MLLLNPHIDFGGTHQRQYIWLAGSRIWWSQTFRGPINQLGRCNLTLHKVEADTGGNGYRASKTLQKMNTDMCAAVQTPLGTAALNSSLVYYFRNKQTWLPQMLHVMIVAGFTGFLGPYWSPDYHFLGIFWQLRFKAQKPVCTLDILCVSLVCGTLI